MTNIQVTYPEIGKHHVQIAELESRFLIIINEDGSWLITGVAGSVHPDKESLEEFRSFINYVYEHYDELKPPYVGPIERETFL